MKSLSKHLFSLLTLLSAALSYAGTGVSRTVNYSDDQIVPIKAKIKFSTLIVLPKSEKIMDYTTGDKEFWIINGSQNFCYVKPAKTGISSNINLITASGHVYSFLLTEAGKDDGDFDLKVFVDPVGATGNAIIPNSGAPLPPFVPASDVVQQKARDAAQIKTFEAQAQKEVASYKQAASAAQSQVSTAIDQYRSDYPIHLHFDYVYEAQKAPFFITAIYHDEIATYIRSDAEEKPVIYELKDGVPTTVNFQLRDGVYVVPEVLDRGYLVLGKKMAEFQRVSYKHHED
jgi:type IV secretory pathway VirB9-like protein